MLPLLLRFVTESVMLLLDLVLSLRAVDDMDANDEDDDEGMVDPPEDADAGSTTARGRS